MVTGHRNVNGNAMLSIESSHNENELSYGIIFHCGADYKEQIDNKLCQIKIIALKKEIAHKEKIIIVMMA